MIDQTVVERVVVAIGIVVVRILIGDHMLNSNIEDQTDRIEVEMELKIQRIDRIHIVVVAIDAQLHTPESCIDYLTDEQHYHC